MKISAIFSVSFFIISLTACWQGNKQNNKGFKGSGKLLFIEDNLHRCFDSMVLYCHLKKVYSTSRTDHKETSVFLKNLF